MRTLLFHLDESQGKWSTAPAGRGLRRLKSDGRPATKPRDLRVTRRPDNLTYAGWSLVPHRSTRSPAMMSPIKYLSRSANQRDHAFTWSLRQHANCMEL